MVVNINLARPLVLVHEQDPDVHLSLIELIAYAIEIVIEDLAQVVFFDCLQLLEQLFELLFALIEFEHDFKFPLEYLSQKLSFDRGHIADQFRLIEPIVEEGSQTFELTYEGRALP